jgi:hypothetical protein
LIALGLGPVIANRAAAVKPKAYQAVLLMESGFLKAPNQRKPRTFLTTSQIAECADRNLTDSAFRLIGLSFVVLQLPLCLVPELVPSSLRLTRFFGNGCARARISPSVGIAHSGVASLPFFVRQPLRCAAFTRRPKSEQMTIELWALCSWSLNARPRLWGSGGYEAGPCAGHPTGGVHGLTVQCPPNSVSS